MKLEFHGHDERYIVEQSMMNLFPLESRCTALWSRERRTGAA